MRAGLLLIRVLADILTDVGFRSVDVRRRGNEPGGAELILASHAGGLADILLVIKASRRFPRFLARDVIWKVPLGAAVMRTVGGIPVHRRQDHGGVASNVDMFEDVYEALAAGDTVAIYPEGESVAAPHLAPLRTGAARIALGALRRGKDVMISPMGLSYFDVSVLRSRGLVDCGEPFKTSDVVASLDVEGPVDETNRALVDAVTEVFAQRLGQVSDHYHDWEQRRRLELAASTYLQVRRPGAPIPYADIAIAANRLASADEAARAKVNIAAAAYEAELELLGVGPRDVSRAAMLGSRVLAEVTGLAALAPLAAYGLMVNSAGILGLRLISLSGLAPPTAATVKPAFAVLAFPASWVVAGMAGHRRRGIWLGVLLAATGPASLAAAVRVGERGQLLYRISRALRRDRGLGVGQPLGNRQQVVESVSAVLRPTAPEPDQT